MMIRSLEKSVEFEVAVFPAPDVEPRYSVGDYYLDDDATQMQFIVTGRRGTLMLEFDDDPKEFPQGARVNLVREADGRWFLSNTGWESRQGMLLVELSSDEEGEEAKT